MPSANTIIVGGENKDCTVQKVANVIRPSASFHLFLEFWRGFADNLNIPELIKKQVAKELDKDSSYDALTCLVHVWVGDKGSKATLDLLILAFKENGMTVLADLLDKEFVRDVVNENLSPTLSLVKKDNVKFDEHLQNPVENFTGRGRELETLQKIIKNRNKKNIPNLVCICGLGGIGKTQLARKFIQENAQDFDGNIVWLNALTEVNLIESFTDFSKQCNLQNKTATKEEEIIKLVDEAYNYFEKSKALFIFDDAEKQPWLKKFFPVKNPNLTILITSREHQWYPEVKIFELKEMSESDAIDLVTGELQKHCVEFIQSDVLKLVKRVQGYPLALQQAIACITFESQDSHYSITEYLKEFELNKEDFLSINVREKLDKLFPDDDYAETTFTTWITTIKKITTKPEGTLANWILNIVAYIDERIKKDLFYKCDPNENLFEAVINYGSDQIGKSTSSYVFNSGENIYIYQNKIKSALRLLVNFSMLNSESYDILSIHRLVQEVTRITLSLDKTKESIVFEDVFNILNIDNPENIIHLVKAWKYGMEQETRKKNELLTKHTPKIPNIMIALEKKRRSKEALDIGQETLEMLELQNLQNDSYLAIKNIHASMLISMGRDNDGLKEVEDAFSKAGLKYKENDPRLLSIQTGLAAAHQKSGDLNKAETHILSVIETTMTNFGPGHKDSLNAKQNYVVLLTDSGKFDKAFEIIPELITGYQEFTGKNKIEAYRASTNFAHVYYKSGNYQQALELMENAYQKIKCDPDDDPIYFANFCYNYIKLLNNESKYEYASKIIQENYKRIKSDLGKYHEATIRLLQISGTVLRLMGEIESAKAKHYQAYQYFVKLYNENDVNTQLAKREWAEDYFASGEYSKAANEFEDIIKVLEVLNANEKELQEEIKLTRCRLEDALAMGEQKGINGI